MRDAPCGPSDRSAGAVAPREVLTVAMNAADCVGGAHARAPLRSAPCRVGRWRSDARRTARGRPALLLAPLLLAPLLLLLPVLGTTGERTWREGFESGRLDSARWVITAEGDFRERTVAVVDLSRQGPRDFRLRLRADTRGTRDDTVKYLGVRTVDRVVIVEGTRIGVTLDWNDQANGSYLSAAMVLTPETTSGNPLRGGDWLKVEYVGVPPGRNARLEVGSCVGGRERTLFTEGWPERNRGGRRIGVQELLLVVARSSFAIHENGQRVFESEAGAVPFEAAHLHLQLSSHSNYPPREVFFDDVSVSAPPPSAAGRATPVPRLIAAFGVGRVREGAPTEAGGGAQPRLTRARRPGPPAKAPGTLPARKRRGKSPSRAGATGLGSARARRPGPSGGGARSCRRRASAR